jgi:hypothetical protein
MQHIGILHQLARTGGTIINRCIGCMRDIVMLSELHPTFPQARRFHPLYQAGQWFDLITPEEQVTLRANALREGKRGSFVPSIKLIEERTRSSGRHLLIREFSHADFIRTPRTQPVFRSRMVDELGRLYALRRSAMVRHPLDQWRSLQDYPASRGRSTLPDYLHGHRRFAEMASEVGFVRYEDFCRDPAATLQQLCGNLGVPFDAEFSERWMHYDRLNGDVSRPPGLPIQARHRPPPSDRLMEALLQSADYRASLALLGYNTDSR